MRKKGLVALSVRSPVLSRFLVSNPVLTPNAQVMVVYDDDAAFLWPIIPGAGAAE